MADQLGPRDKEKSSRKSRKPEKVEVAVTPPPSVVPQLDTGQSPYPNLDQIEYDRYDILRGNVSDVKADSVTLHSKTLEGLRKLESFLNAIVPGDLKFNRYADLDEDREPLEWHCNVRKES